MKSANSQQKSAAQFQASIPFCVFVLSILVLSMLTGCSKMGFSTKKPSANNNLGECVVLLHGMGRTHHSLDDMQDQLTKAGFHTVNYGYPSRKKDIESIARDYVPVALDKCQQFTPTAVHFVTHSLGGIVLRMAIQQNRPENLGRVVMLSPPNRGSSLVDTLKDWWFYEWINGPAGQQLSTSADSVPNKLGRVDYPVGIITGDRHAFFDAWFSSKIPGEDDGKVSVERAKVDGMSSFLVVHESHPFIMNDEYVQRETVYFLKHGTFKMEEEPSSTELGPDNYDKDASAQN